MQPHGVQLWSVRVVQCSSPLLWAHLPEEDPGLSTAARSGGPWVASLDGSHLVFSLGCF